MAGDPVSSDPLHPPTTEGGGPQQELQPAGGGTEDQGPRERGPIPGGRLLCRAISQPGGPQGAGGGAALQAASGQPPCLQVRGARRVR